MYRAAPRASPTRRWVRVNHRLEKVAIWHAANMFHPQTDGQLVPVRTTLMMFPLSNWGEGMGRTVSTYGREDAQSIVHVPPGHPMPRPGDFVHSHTVPNAERHYYTRVIA